MSQSQYKEPLSIGEVINQMLPDMKAWMEKMQKFCQDIRGQMEGVSEMCIEHTETELEVDWDRTFGQSWKQGKLVPCFKQCEKCIAQFNATIVNDKWLKMGVPNKIAHATFANYEVAHTEQLKARRKFEFQLKKGSGFIIALGTPGTGKSHLSVATLKVVGNGLFVTLHDLIGELRQTYTDNSGQDEFVEKYRNAKLLVLDELTPEVKGVDISPTLYRILAQRYDAGLLTVITSNESMDTIKEILGLRLADRIRENHIVVNFTWESHRKAS